MFIWNLILAAIRALAAAKNCEPPETGEEVDALLDERAAALNYDVDHRGSVVDLFKVLGIDSSLPNRREVANEMGFKGDFTGSGEDNIWLLKKIRERLADGTPIPIGESE